MKVVKIAFSITTLLFVALALSFLSFDKFFPLRLDKYEDRSCVLLDRQGRILSVHLTQDEYLRLAVKLHDVDPLFIRLLINYEDKRFYSHPGIDPFALFRAIGQYVSQGKIISGGSTLTMQVARLLERRPRNMRSKIIELLRALQLEYHFSKHEILEMYLCLAPYGGNIEGIRGASLSYFEKEPKYLRPAEAAMLAVLPQSPTRLRPHIDNTRSKLFRDKLIDKMQNAKIFTNQQCREAKEEALPTKRSVLPKLALHLLTKKALMLKKEKEGKEEKKERESYFKEVGDNKKNILGMSAEIRTTLDKNLQLQLEHYLKSILPFLEETQNIASIVIDNKTREILAYVGSADFFSEARSGQVDIMNAIRSPGSTLKPFIYGLCFDQKLLHPETVVKDMPMNFSGGYAPSNFRDIFHGEVTIREALQQSLNVPAVLALEKVGAGCFCDWLSNVGVNLKLNDKYSKPSLPIALGGVGTRFLDLVSLYVALGNEGQFKPLSLLNTTLLQEKLSSEKLSQEKLSSDKLSQENSNFTQEPSALSSLSNPTQFLSKEAAWHITKILQETHAPNGFVDSQFTTQGTFAYKTGTSYGYRDALAIGYSEAFTIGVWVGKPDGTPSLNQTGRNTAAPILFKILKMLPQIQNKHSSNLPPSGFLSLKGDELPPNLRLLQRDNSKSTLTKKRSLEIHFPKEGALIYLDETKPLHFIVSGGKPPYYALINGEPLPESFSKSHIIWQPKTLGFTEVSIIDSVGQSDAVSIEIR